MTAGEDELLSQKQLFENLLVVVCATAELPTLEATLQNVLDVAVALTGVQYGGSGQFYPGRTSVGE